MDGVKTNYKVATVYTDILASYKYETNSKGTVKASTGKVIAGVTTSDSKPAVSKNKITDTSAAQMATAKVANGVVTITAKKICYPAAMGAESPFRTISYDGAAYRNQIYSYSDGDGKRHKSTERYPVVTLVLYMGYKKRWDKAKTIYEALGDKLDESLKPFVNDYPIHLFEIAFMEDEDVQKFQSDFRIVADYLVQMRKNNNYKPADIQIRHVREVLDTMTALTNDTRFREVYAENEKGDEPKTMCEVLDRVEARGRKAERMELTKLMAFLVKNGRYEDVVRAETDEAFLDQLLTEFQGKLASAKQMTR